MPTRWDYIKLGLILLAVSLLPEKWREKLRKDVIKKVLEEE